MSVDEDEFRYPNLVNRWQRERSTTALTKTDTRFYEHFDLHLRNLVAEYQKEAAVNPATPKVLILQDEMSNLQRVRDDFYDLREKKIVTLAIIAARGGKPDTNNMTQEEEVFFDGLLSIMRDARRNLLLRGSPAKELPKPASGPPVAPEQPSREVKAAAQPAAVMAERAPANESGPEAPLPGAPTPALRAPTPAVEQLRAEDDKEAPKRMGPARALVRILGPVAPFVASDMREYRLTVDDVVAVPKEIATALAGRGLAKIVGA